MHASHQHQFLPCVRRHIQYLEWDWRSRKWTSNLSRILYGTFSTLSMYWNAPESCLILGEDTYYHLLRWSFVRTDKATNTALQDHSRAAHLKGLYQDIGKIYPASQISEKPFVSRFFPFKSNNKLKVILSKLILCSDTHFLSGMGWIANTSLSDFRFCCSGGDRHTGKSVHGCDCGDSCYSWILNLGSLHSGRFSIAFKIALEIADAMLVRVNKPLSEKPHSLLARYRRYYSNK